jgi:cobalt-zinc-cadmium efflux system protein
MSRTTRLVIVLAINAALVVGQVIAAVAAHSTSLFSDAGHNLTDVVGVGIALLAVRWALRPRSDSRSFGNHRGTILAALMNSAALAVVTVAIVAVSMYRLLHPVHVDGGLMVIVACIAMVVNAGAALTLRDGSSDLNMRAAFLHMAADVLSSFCVLVAGLVIVLTGGGAWDRIDPIASLCVATLIVIEAFRLSRASVDVLLESTPSDVDLTLLRQTMTGINGVDEVHDLHVWSLSSEVRALSAHLVLTGHPTLEEAQSVGTAVRREVEGPFDIAHTTFELECERCIDEEIDPCGMDDMESPVPSRSGSTSGQRH